MGKASTKESSTLLIIASLIALAPFAAAWYFTEAHRGEVTFTISTMYYRLNKMIIFRDEDLMSHTFYIGMNAWYDHWQHFFEEGHTYRIVYRGWHILNVTEVIG